MGFGEDFWNTDEECLDMILKPAGITFDEFRNIGILYGTKEYRKFEHAGFATPSGKVEIFSERLKDWGFDPLPTYRKSTTNSDSAFPLVLTSMKRAPYRHSGGRQIPSLRKLHPEPSAIIHPDTGKNYGIHEGSWVVIETTNGKITQKAVFDSVIDPEIVCVDYGWWYPEASQTELFGWQDANVNILVGYGAHVGKEMGTPQLRGIPCRISSYP
jgi:anaerobic selenocysteine-containing dehydrogenase